MDSQNQWSYEFQRQFWNRWDTENLKPSKLGKQAVRRGDTALGLLGGLELPARAAILEVGCGNGWFARRLMSLGSVTGIDISDAAIEQAVQQVQGAKFLAGDVLKMKLPSESFDVVVAMETFSHVRQPEFVCWAAEVLKPGGYLLLTTQNRKIYMRSSSVKPPGEGQVRRWVTQAELKALLEGRFSVEHCFTIEPGGSRGLLRVVNSRKLNGALGKLFSPAKVKALKERLGFGQTIVTMARRRP